jgi:hypothetical protein
MNFDFLILCVNQSGELVKTDLTLVDDMKLSNSIDYLWFQIRQIYLTFLKKLYFITHGGL